MKLVALHGFMGSPESWSRVLAPDATPVLPFHGAKGATYSSWNDALAGLEASLPEGPLVLLGYSLGARLALGLTARLGQRVLGSVLVSVHAGLEGDARDERERFENGIAERLESTPSMGAFVDEWERLPLFATQSPEQRALQRPAREAHDPRVLAGAFRVLGTSRMPNYERLLGDLRTPLLFVAGAADAKYLELARRYAAAAARGRFVVVPGGHNPLLEAPALVGEAVRSFLDTVDE